MLIPGALHGNLQRSIDAYIDQQLAQGAGFVVRYQGDPWPRTPVPVRWLEVHHQQLGARFSPRVTTQGYGNEATWLLDLNHFEQRDARFDDSGNATRYSLTDMLDTTQNAFNIRASVPVLDFTQPTPPTIGALVIREQPETTPVFPPDEMRLDQQNLRVQLVYDASVT